jgi:D-3-phosphoglycerate dehydrogenase
MKKILITDKIHDVCISNLKSAGFEVDYKTMMKFDELLNSISNYNALIVRSATKVSSDIIEAGSNLEIIGRAGTGVDNIDVAAATRKGIIVMNTPGGNTISAAELAFAHIISLCRNLPQANRSMKNGNWDRKSFYGTELNGKTIGIIGLGQIGREVALRAKAFKMKVIAFDPVASKDWAASNWVDLVSLNELFAVSDIITLHVPHNDQTHHLINSETISQMKDGVKIVNCARGGIIDENAILNFIHSGKVSGLSLDVYENEPPIFGDLIAHPNVICTPHLGASTDDALENVATQISQQILDYYSTGKISGGINADILKYLTDEKLKPFLDLSEKLGQFVSSLDPHRLSYSLELVGENLHKNDEVLNAAFQKGLLISRMDEPINYINVATYASSAGIQATVSKNKSVSNYKNLVTVEFQLNQQHYSISATVVNGLPRVVGINDYRIEFNLFGKIIFYRNEDKPGMLAYMANNLAEKGINIAGLALGRSEKGEEALTVITVDDEVNKEDLLNNINNNEIKEVFCLEIK